MKPEPWLAATSAATLVWGPTHVITWPTIASSSYSFGQAALLSAGMTSELTSVRRPRAVGGL